MNVPDLSRLIGCDRTISGAVDRGSDGARSRRAGPGWRSRGIRGAGQLTSDRMYALAARILRDSDPGRGCPAGRPHHRLAPAPDPARPGSLRSLGQAPCSSMRATPRPGVGARGRRTSESCRSTGRRLRMTCSPIDDRDALERAFRRLPIEQRAVFVLHHHVGSAADRDRRDPRHPGRDGPLATPLRDQGAACGRRGRRGARRPRRTDGMTSERDFDRLARAWLELGPTRRRIASVAAVLQAAQTTPQARRPSWRRSGGLRHDSLPSRRPSRPSRSSPSVASCSSADRTR